MKNISSVSYLTAVTAALKAAGLSPAQARFTELKLEDGLYYMSFTTGWVRFEAYVSAGSGEVLGLNSIPSVDSEVLPYRYAPVLSFEDIAKTA